MAYKGKFKPKNRDKYKGNPTNIIYRSLWERRFMVYCDSNNSVVKWSSEEIVIPYRSPFDRKIHKIHGSVLCTCISVGSIMLCGALGSSCYSKKRYGTVICSTFVQSHLITCFQKYQLFFGTVVAAPTAIP